MTKKTTGSVLRQIPSGVWILGFVSMLMDISSEMVHSLLPLFMVGTLGASAFMVGLIEGLAESTALIVKVFSGALSDYFGKRKGLAIFGYSLGALTKLRIPRKLDTCSAANWTVIPAQTGHLFHAKLDTCSTPNWTPWVWRRGVEVWFYSGLAELVKFARFFRSESPFKLS